MTGTMDRYAFEQMCKSHKEWLICNTHDCLERQWLIQMLEEAPRRYYERCEPVEGRCD